MKRNVFTETKAAALGWLFVLLFSLPVLSQTNRASKRKAPARPGAGKRIPKAQQAAAPKVTLVDEVGLRKLLLPKDKPLLINFWATWCDPCREEFPDLVKFNNEYKGKIDFLTVSLDEPEEIATTVPKFLSAMKADMPAYLLDTEDESAVISSVSKDWRGGMPFTALYDPKGGLAYFREGKVVLDDLRSEVNKLIPAAAAEASQDLFIVANFVKVIDGRRDEALYYYENNWKLYRDEAKKRGVIDSYELMAAASDKNADFDLILVTRYRGNDQFRNIEKNFEPILKQLRPNGPILKNSIKPEQFRRNVSEYTGRSVFSSQN